LKRGPRTSRPSIPITLGLAKSVDQLTGGERKGIPKTTGKGSTRTIGKALSKARKQIPLHISTTNSREGFQTTGRGKGGRRSCQGKRGKESYV